MLYEKHRFSQVVSSQSNYNKEVSIVVLNETPSIKNEDTVTDSVKVLRKIH